MIKTVRDAFKIHPMVTDYRMTEAIENLSDLIADEGDGAEFFERNYVTQGMSELFREGLLRLSGKSDQAAFELSQAMGGGKTHLMVAFGLLARHPKLRAQVLPPELYNRIHFDRARLAAFTGRNDPDHFIWGEIGIQLGKADLARPYWADGPRGIDEAGWIRIIGDEATLILLDELPPYLAMAGARTVGRGSLADLVTYSISGLLSAAMKLKRCCVVLANLSGSYVEQTRDLAKLVSNLRQETRRQAQTITPVQLAGNEIYEILKKRLFIETPTDDVVDSIAEAFAEQVKAAEDGGYITARSMEQVAAEVRETYPFHPSFKNLVALFKENEGFRQTRGLMQFTARLLKSVWNRPGNDVFLIGTQHLDLNDVSVRDEIQRINPALLNAMVTDIADNGNARAEEIDDDLASDAASQVAKLVLSASLSRVMGGHVGLTQAEIVEFLAAPNRKADEFIAALERLRNKAWFLHREGESFYFKETENLSRTIEHDALQVPPHKVQEAMEKKLSGLLQPATRKAYQEVLVLPLLDEVNLSSHRILLVVEPDGRTPPKRIQEFFDFQPEKNHVLILSGQDSYLANEVEYRLRELFAVERIHSRLKPGDTLFEEARDKFEELEGRFQKAIAGAYNRLFFPGGDGQLAMTTIDNGLNFGKGEHSAEAQIENLLASSRADHKLALDFEQDLNNYWTMAETMLWPIRERRTPWRDILMRAKTDASWPWMPGARGLEALKDKALQQGRWREGADGYIERGPFPVEKTSVNITVQVVDRASGEATLTLTPRNAGASPRIYVSKTNAVSEQDQLVEDPDNFRTREATLYFIAVDSDGKHESGESKRWVADLSIRHEIKVAADRRKVELKVTPRGQLLYTLDGANPKEGIDYREPFEVPRHDCTLLVYAFADEAEKTTTFRIPADGDNRVHIDDRMPAKLRDTARVSLDSTETAFQFIQKFKERADTRMRGVQLIIGEGEHSVQVRFNERTVTARMIEATIQAIRNAIDDDQASVQIVIRGGVEFGDGYALREFAELARLELRAADVVQEG